MLVVQFFFGLLLASNLLAGAVLQSGFLVWAILVAVTFTWLLIGKIIHPFIERNIKSDYQDLFTSNIQKYISGALLILILIFTGLYSDVDDLRGLTFEASYANRTLYAYTESFILNGIVEFHLLIETLFLWLPHYIDDGTQLSPVKLIIWIIILFKSWLFIWPLVLIFQSTQLIIGLMKSKKGFGYEVESKSEN